MEKSSNGKRAGWRFDFDQFKTWEDLEEWQDKAGTGKLKDIRPMLPTVVLSTPWPDFDHQDADSYLKLSIAQTKEIQTKVGAALTSFLE